MCTGTGKGERDPGKFCIFFLRDRRLVALLQAAPSVSRGLQRRLQVFGEELLLILHEGLQLLDGFVVKQLNQLAVDVSAEGKTNIVLCHTN